MGSGFRSHNSGLLTWTICETRPSRSAIFPRCHARGLLHRPSPSQTQAFSKSVVAVLSLLFSLGITVCLDFPCTSFMCCQKEFEAVSEGWSLAWRNNFVACAHSLFLNICVTLLCNCLNLSCVSAVVSFLIFLNADRFALIAVSTSGVTYGFLVWLFWRFLMEYAVWQFRRSWTSTSRKHH